MSLKVLLYVTVILFTLPSFGRELKDLNLEITTPKKGNEAKQDAFEQATEQATHRLTEDLLGAEKTAKVWATVRPRLLKNSSRYVLFIKGSTPIEAGGQSKVLVQMRLSPDNLESLLREAGALGGGSVRLLPLITFSEPRGTRYIWWADMGDDKNPTFAQELFKKTHNQLAAKFKGKNVYVLDPTSASFRMSVPSAYRSEGLRREDQILLAQYLKADVVMSGRIDVARAEGAGTRVNYDVQLWQAKAGRALSEVQRSEPVSNDAPKVITTVVEQNNDRVLGELAGKLNDAMTAGSLNLNVVRISVEGSLGYPQQVEFKRQLSSIREIKLLRERMFEASRVTFEAETPTSGGELAKAIARNKFNQFRVEVDSVQDNGLVLSVRPL